MTEKKKRIHIHKRNPNTVTWVIDALDLTLGEYAKLIHVSACTISQWLRKGAKAPKFSRLCDFIWEIVESELRDNYDDFMYFDKPEIKKCLSKNGDELKAWYIFLQKRYSDITIGKGRNLASETLEILKDVGCENKLEKIENIFYRAGLLNFE